MNLLYHPVFLQHHTGTHPENAGRLEAFRQLAAADMPDGFPWLELIHSPAHIAQVRAACAESRMLDADTLTSPGSFEAACRAVGAVVLASRQGDFALVRPPGHHAYPFKSGGFCLFNSIAVATQQLVAGNKRVFILDFDGHCGDGTSHCFEATDQVLYCSLHQYPAYPGTGWVDEIGSGKGRGYTVNLPLPPGSGDDIFLDAIGICLQIMKQFQPDAVAVSAGFDAHLNDPLLQLRVTESSFHKTGILLRQCQYPVFAALEGGYNPAVLSRCIYNFQSGINGLDMPFDAPPTVSRQDIREEYAMRINAVKRNLLPWWKFNA
jgi:acetoin utilization deacetylase AcuC-like enzyme